MKKNDASLFNTTFGNRYFVAAVSASLIFIFMGLLLDRVGREFDQVDQTHFEYRLTEIKAAIRIMEAELISQNALHAANKLDGANPMDWMKGDVSHYLGAMSPYKAIESPGNWFYNPVAQEIGYVPKGIYMDKSHINREQYIEKILRFQVRALRSREESQKYTGLALVMLSQSENEK